METNLFAISPIDGRYYHRTSILQPVCSEYGLMYFRVIVEIKWLQTIAANPEISEMATLNQTALTQLDQIIEKFNEQDAERIKSIEAEINHDVKAVEYFLKEKLAGLELNEISELVHFACTSEDINNLAYGFMLKIARGQCLLPLMNNIIEICTQLAHTHSAQPMLSRTHGQAASPTTVGKEFANFASRLKRQYDQISQQTIMGKFNGSVGNYNAHTVACPNLDWITVSKQFVESLGLTWNAYTTQIEPHDTFAELFSAVVRFNTILIDFCRDIWGYISIGYFNQKLKSEEVGSSVMPHKVNPIDFENAEGNLGVANALLNHFSAKLPISRWQRDLTDSTTLRNVGTAFAHSMLSYQSILAGLSKLSIHVERLNEDLENNWEILSEVVQTVMRRYGIEKPYEKLKALTRGKKIDQNTLHEFVDTLSLPDSVKKTLKQLTPSAYTGLATKLAEDF
jgi:adenylosuccinate lyase